MKDPVGSSSAPQNQVLFTQKNPRESICMTCYATIRTARGETLQVAQARHVAECGGSIVSR